MFVIVGGRCGRSSSFAVVEERMFSTGNRDMVVYLELCGIERKGQIGTKGKWIGYLAYVENVRRRVGMRFVQLSCK